MKRLIILAAMAALSAPVLANPSDAAALLGEQQKLDIKEINTPHSNDRRTRGSAGLLGVQGKEPQPAVQVIEEMLDTEAVNVVTPDAVTEDYPKKLAPGTELDDIGAK